LYRNCFASLFYRYTSENFRREFQLKNYEVSRNSSENYESIQNMANPNISLIFGSAGFIYFLKSARKSTITV